MTLCAWANHLHHDLVAADHSHLGTLSQILVEAGRTPHKFTKRDMKEALDTSTHDGCPAANVNSDRCVCEDEIPATQTLPWLARMRSSVARALRWICRDTKQRTR
jgi:hypothetical protein